MSSVNPEVLKSPSDNNIPFLTRPEDFTTAQIIHDSLNEFGLLIKTFKIVNNDGNAVQYRTQSPSGLIREVPPNSEDTVDEWTSFLQIIPNGATGNGTLEMDLVEIKDAKNTTIDNPVSA